jgi:hypothetical protein
VSALFAAGTASLDFPILTVLVVLPAAGALLVALLPKARAELVKATAVLVSVAAAGLGGWLLVEFETGASGFQFVSRQSWIADLGIAWHLGVDGISLFLVVLTLFLFPIAMLATDPGHDPKPYFAWLLLLEAGCIGTSSSSCSRSCWSPCTSSSGVGATAGGSTPHSSSSCSRCSARRSCWSASWPWSC